MMFYIISGLIRGVHCALHIGDADGYESFVGEMDEVKYNYVYAQVSAFT